MEVVNEFASARPSPALLPYVERYLGYRMEGFAPGVHRGLPSRNLTFIVSLDRKVEMLALPDPRQGPESMQAFVGGLSTSPALIGHDGNQHGLAVDVTPFGAEVLLGMPSSELGSWVVDLADVLGARGRNLPDRLVDAGTWSRRFAIMDEELTSAVQHARTSGPSDEVTYAWSRMVVAGGGLKVEALAAEVGWSRRHFTERFHREVGLAPRQLARVLRFERSRAFLAMASRPALADIAVQCGYYDQPHMNREWRDLAGCSPTQWLVEEQLPSVQDTAEYRSAH